MTVIDNVAVEGFVRKVEQLGLSRKDRIRVTFERLEEVVQPVNKWAQLADRAHRESILLGASGEVAKYSQEFREDFEFKHDS